MKIDIIGGGISGLSLAYMLLAKANNHTINLYESDEKVGGKIWTERSEGFVTEAGVNGFLDNRPATLTLSKELNLQPIRSNDNARKRFICLDGKLKEIPEKPLSFMFSDFLSISGRINMVLEYFRPPNVKEDESMESFAVRRVGREFFEKLLDPMASGVYAGDPAKLSIRSCFAKVYELEKNYGGLIKGFLNIAKEKKKLGQKTEAGPGGTLHSFDRGMYSLIEVLRQILGERVFTNKKAVSVEKKSVSYIVNFDDGSMSESDVLILAVPAHNASILLKDLDKGLSDYLNQIQYPPLTVVSLGFKNRDFSGIDLNAFGFLVPARESRKILGTLFDTSIFPNRAPEGYTLLRTMVGGARFKEFALLEEDKLREVVLSELRDLISLRADPHYVRIFRWQKAIPQYNVGHHLLLENIDRLLTQHKGLFLTGNAYRGVAVNDCIANSEKLASQIIRDF